MKRIFTCFLSLTALFAGWTAANAQAPYCSSGSTQTYDSDITYVELNTIKNNTGGASCATYTYFNTLSTNLDKGGIYPMTVTLGVHTGGSCGSAGFTKSARVFIDWNQDNVFQVPGEVVGFTNYSSGTHSTTFNVTVPCNAVSGTTRMRVVCVENTPGAIQPCGSFTYGETEDYNVNVLAGSNPSADFSLPDTVYVGATATFVNTNQSGYTHEWYNSDVNGMSTVASTSVNYSYVFSSAGTYDIKLKSTNCQGTAQVTKSVTVIMPTSIPVPLFVTSVNHYIYTGNPVEIQFHDLSLFGPTAWDWTVTPTSLGGAPWFWSTGNQFSQNPGAFFYDIGTYEVCLTVTNVLGTSAPLCKTAYIVIEPPSGQNFTNLMGTDQRSILDSGLIYDSGGPNGNYGNNEFNTFTIEPCGATSITLHFNSFNTQAGTDRINIYNGATTSDPMIGSYSGTTIPNDVTASSGRMTLEFISNGSTVASGFAATWSALIPQNGAPGADFELADTLYLCASGTDVTFENASTGIVDNQATYDWIVDYDPNITYPPGYCDFCDETSPTTTYFNNQTYMVRMVLKSCEGNDTIVKSFFLDNTTNNPTVDFTVSHRILPVNGTALLKEESVAACSFEWSIFPSTYTIENGGTINDPEILVKFTAAASYHITLKVTNDNGTTTHTKTNIIDVIEYCTPVVTLPSISDIGINRVNLNTIENSSASGQAPGYTDYSKTISTTLTSGQSYNITVVRDGNANNANRKVWIDFNRDGDFTDANELVASEASSSNKSFTATFVVPDEANMVEGESRMRVGIAIDNSSNTPCGPNQVGEFEDYGIVLRLDDVPPVITLLGADTVWVEVGTAYSDAGATATDNIQGNMTSSIVTNSTVDLTQPGIYYVIYNLTDGSGNAAIEKKRVVIVVADLTVPVITLIGNDPHLHSVKLPFVDPGATAIDNPGSVNITANILVSGSVDVNVLGDYILTYKVTDAFGNSNAVTRTVQVRDTTKPVFGISNNVFWQVTVPFTHNTAVTDNFDNSVTAQVVSGSVNPNIMGTYIVVYKATDASGNTTIHTVQYTVGDSIKPTIVTPPGTDIFIVDVNNINYIEPKVTAFDNYYPSVQLNRDASALNIFQIGQYPVIYTATDLSGNTATYTRIFDVVDRIAPEVQAAPLNLVRWSTYDPMTGVNVKDNYWDPQWFITNNKVEITFNNVNIDYPGIYTIRYRATDGSGNVSAEFSRLVSVVEMLGAEELSSESIRVYPNPTQGKFTIQISGSLNPEARIVVTNAVGELVAVYLVSDMSNNQVEVNLDGMASGLYLVRFENGNMSAVKKLILAD